MTTKPKSAKLPTAESTNCPQCKTGTLFDVTSKLAAALGQKHVQCDKCGAKYGFNLGAETS